MYYITCYKKVNGKVNWYLIKKFLQIRKNYITSYLNSYAWFNNYFLKFKYWYQLVIRLKTNKYYIKLLFLIHIELEI